jgi:prophage antirepressor-like protein
MALSTLAAPSGCSYMQGLLTLNGERLPFIHYRELDEIWMPGKPVMKTTGERNITHILGRVFADDKMSFERLVATKGLPLEGCYGFVTPPNPTDHNEKIAIWVNESGFYAMVLGSRKPDCVAFQRWVLREVLPSIRRTGSYGASPPQASISPEVVVALTSAVQAMNSTSTAVLAMMPNFGEDLVRSLQRALTPQVVQDGVVGALAQTHGVLEITRSSAGAATTFAQRNLLSMGTKVTDATLPVIEAEGGPLHVSNFLEEMGVRADVIRRLTPTFAQEVNRRKVAAANGGVGARGPLWIAWSQGSWRHYHTEADRDLLWEVFSDPLTSQNIEKLESEKRKAELDVETSALQLAKRVCADVVEAHKNDMLQIVEAERTTHQTILLQIVDTMQNEHKNDMLNLQELWQKRFEESATQINSFKEWFMKTFCSEIVNQICFAQSQKFVDLRDALREAMTNPTGTFVDALRRAVKKPAIKGTSNALGFPDDQRVTADEERFVVSLSVTLTEALEALDRKRSLPGVRPLPPLTYGAWKKCRGLIGIRYLALRKKDHAATVSIVSKPLLWSTSADGSGRSNGGGQHYVYLKECRSSIGGHSKTYIQEVLKQKFKNRTTVEEHLRVLISETIPETWPLSTSSLDAFDYDSAEKEAAQQQQ